MIPNLVKAHGWQYYARSEDGKHYCTDIKARVRWRLAVDPRRRRFATPTLLLGPRDGVVLLTQGSLYAKLYVDR